MTHSNGHTIIKFIKFTSNHQNYRLKADALVKKQLAKASFIECVAYVLIIYALTNIIRKPFQIITPKIYLRHTQAATTHKLTTGTTHTCTVIPH